MSSTSAIISIEDLSFTYHSAENSFSLKIPHLDFFAGEKVFIYGPSGSGKTTLLGLISGVLSQKTGSISILQNTFSPTTSLVQKDKFRADHLGYIFQQFNLISYLSAKENILLSLQFSKIKKNKYKTEANINDDLISMSERLGIRHLLDQKVTELSIGQQQRVAACRALLGSPEILIADEPTSALDFDHKELFLKLLFEEARLKNTTILFVSHDRSLEKLFERSINLKDFSDKNEAS